MSAVERTFDSRYVTFSVAQSKRSRVPKLPRQSRSKATVDAIVVGATQVLGKDGWHNSNVNEMARRAGVSIGSVYQYFPTKEQLGAEVARQVSNEMLAQFVNYLVEIIDLPPREALPNVVRMTLELFRAAPNARATLIREAPAIAASFATPLFDAHLNAALVSYFETHRRALRVRDHRVAASVLCTAVEAIASQLTQDPSLNFDILVEETSDLAARYLFAEAP